MEKPIVELKYFKPEHIKIRWPIDSKYIQKKSWKK
jgi:hypothetical protein